MTDSEVDHCSADGNVSEPEIEYALDESVTFEFVCGLGGDIVTQTLAHDVSFGHMHMVLKEDHRDPLAFVSMLLGDDLWKDPKDLYAKFCDDEKVRKLIKENDYRLKVLLLKPVNFEFVWGLGGETLPLNLPPSTSVGDIHDMLLGLNQNVSANLLIGDNFNIDLERHDELIYDVAGVRELLLENNNCLRVQVIKRINRMKVAPWGYGPPLTEY